MVNIVTTKEADSKPIKHCSSMVLIGISVYVIIDIILAFLRPDYSWLHNAESDYGRGPYFWLMDINFLLRCFFSLALVRAIFLKFPRSKLIRGASILIVIWAITSGLLAFFADNPYGYPKIGSGSTHLLLAFIAFISILIAMIWFNRLSILPPQNKIVANTLTVIALLSLILLGHAGFNPHSLGGLYERIFLASILAWEVVLAISLSKHEPISNIEK